MASKTEIANKAISHLGIGKAISNLETERSSEGSACRVFYDIARDTTLRSFAWPFATRLVELGLVEEDPNIEWDFSYRYPTNCVSFRKILSGTRNDTRSTRVPYRIASDDSGELILTDMQDAQGEFTFRVDDPQLYPSDFTLALSFQLAALIAPTLTGGDAFKKGDYAMKMFLATIDKARSSAANEEQPEELPDSEFITGRN